MASSCCPLEIVSLCVSSSFLLINNDCAHLLTSARLIGRVTWARPLSSSNFQLFPATRSCFAPLPHWKIFWHFVAPGGSLITTYSLLRFLLMHLYPRQLFGAIVCQNCCASRLYTFGFCLQRFRLWCQHLRLFDCWGLVGSPYLLPSLPPSFCFFVRSEESG